MPVRCDIYPDGGMVDTNALGVFVVRRIGSSPIWGTLGKIVRCLNWLSTLKPILVMDRGYTGSNPVLTTRLVVSDFPEEWNFQNSQVTELVDVTTSVKMGQY